MKYLLEYLKTKKMMLFMILITALVQAFGTLLVPYFVAKMIDVGIANKSIDSIILIGIQMLGAAGLTAFISLIGSYLCADLAASTGKYLREKLFDKTQLLSIQDFQNFGTASMITRATGDVTIIQQTVVMMTQMILPTPLILVAAIIMTYIVYPSLAYIPLAVVVVFVLVILVLFKKSRPISETIQKRVDTVNRIVRESLTGIRVIRAFDNSAYEKNRSDNAFGEYAENVIRLNRIFAKFNPLVWMIMGLAMVAVIWLGGNLVLQGHIQVGSITAVSEYTILMLIYLMMAAMVLVMLPRMLSCLERIEEVLDTEPEIVDSRNTKDIEHHNDKNKISLNNVTFTYDGAEKPILENLSFTCEKGKITAIIGGTGSGKSTIAALMLRLHDIQSGDISVEGVDIRNLSQNELRDRISYVPQKSFLFSGTIAENLKIGNPDASIKELQHAIDIAQAKEFVSSLSKGVDSEVAQGGSNFSGGQKQRLCIARALIKKSPIYIFDDSFSALDYKTDVELRKALKSEVKESAVVIIAQRINTIIDADQIIVLDDGKIAGLGRHDELIKTCDIYQEIAKSQLDGEEAI